MGAHTKRMPKPKREQEAAPIPVAALEASPNALMRRLAHCPELPDEMILHRLQNLHQPG